MHFTRPQRVAREGGSQRQVSQGCRRGGRESKLAVLGVMRFMDVP